MSDTESFHQSKIHSLRPFIVRCIDANFEVMVVLTRPHSETGLASFICYTVSDCFTEHHHRTLRVIVHSVLQLRPKSLRLDLVEVNNIIRANLNSNIASDEIDLSSSVFQLIILLPLICLRINLEEKNGA
jgi:hypothetical protein